MTSPSLAPYHAARNEAALIDQSSAGKIKVTGTDSRELLHSVLTNEIQGLPPGRYCPAALLTATGKILAFMQVLNAGDFYLLVTEPGFEQKTSTLLEKFIITEDVKLEDVTKDFNLVSIVGPKRKAMSLAHSSSFEPLKESRISQSILVVSPSHVAFGRAGLNLPYQKISQETAEILRLEDGVPRFGVDMNEETLLSETGLDEFAASETKGCYPGQEVVARIKTYSGLQRKLVGVVMQEGKGEGNIYSNQKQIGWITSLCTSAALKKEIALGYVAKGFFEAGQEVEVGEKRVKAKTAALPFISPFQAGPRGPS